VYFPWLMKTVGFIRCHFYRVLNSNSSELARSSANRILMATDACRGAVSTARPGLHELNLLEAPDLELMCLWAFNDSATDALRGVEAGSGVPACPCCRLSCGSEGPGAQQGNRRENAKTYHIFFR
jgi:hypothetical protein